MKVRDVVERVAALGLDEAEAAAYVHLSSAGPAKASDVAAAMRVSRAEAYRTLERLEGAGLVTRTLSRPARFVAAAPERLFDDLAALHRAKLAAVERAREDLAPALAALRGEDAAAGPGGFRVTEGRRAAFAVAERMVRAAEGEVKFVDTHAAAVPLARGLGFWDAVVRRVEGGLVVRGVLGPAAAAEEGVEALVSRPNARFRVLEEQRALRVVVADERELLLWVAHDPSSRLAAEGDAALWSDASGLVATASALLDHLWTAAEAGEARGARQRPSSSRSATSRRS